MCSKASPEHVKEGKAHCELLQWHTASNPSFAVLPGTYLKHKLGDAPVLL